MINTKKISKKMAGLSPALIETIIKQSTLYAIRKNEKLSDEIILKHIKIVKGDLLKKFNKENPNFKILEPDEIKGSMEDLIGMEDIKEELLQLEDMFNRKEIYLKNGYDKLFNVMFSGPAGTGKTKIASYLAKKLELPIVIGTANLGNKYINSGVNELKKIFNIANNLMKERESSVIVFLDEAQDLIKDRTIYNSNLGNEERIKMVNELLSNLDGINTNTDNHLIFIISSNFDDSNIKIDEAISRRFNKKIYFRLPNKEERYSILKNLLKDKNVENNLNLKYLSEITFRLSPALLELIVKESILESIRLNTKITNDIIFNQFKTLTIGKTDRKTNTEKTRKIVVLHELGHFIVEYNNIKSLFNINNKLNDNDLKLIKENIKTLEISTESINKVNALGFVLNKETENELLKSVTEYENNIKELYGGLASEEVFFEKQITLGASNDLEKIKSIIETMVYNFGIYTEVYKKTNIQIISNKEKERFENVINKKLKELYNQTKNIIKENK